MELSKEQTIVHGCLAMICSHRVAADASFPRELASWQLQILISFRQYCHFTKSCSGLASSIAHSWQFCEPLRPFGTSIVILSSVPLPAMPIDGRRGDWKVFRNPSAIVWGRRDVLFLCHVFIRFASLTRANTWPSRGSPLTSCKIFLDTVQCSPTLMALRRNILRQQTLHCVTWMIGRATSKPQEVKRTRPPGSRSLSC